MVDKDLKQRRRRARQADELREQLVARSSASQLSRDAVAPLLHLQSNVRLDSPELPVTLAKAL